MKNYIVSRIFVLVSCIFLVLPSAQALKFPNVNSRVNAKVNLKQPKYRGWQKNHKVLKKYMIDRVAIYVPTYFREFEKLNKINKGVLPSDEMVIRRFQRDILELSPGSTHNLAKVGVEYQDMEMRKLVGQYIEEDIFSKNEKKIEILSAKIESIENEMKRLRGLPIVKTVSDVGGLNSSMKRMKLNLGELSKLVKGLDLRIKALSGETNLEYRSDLSQNQSKNETTKWIAFSALALSLLSLLISKGKKSLK